MITLGMVSAGAHFRWSNVLSKTFEFKAEWSLASYMQ
jgi:hypothetical protein